MLISIVTPSLNRAAFILEAVESVRRQDHGEIEHIVVDGGSNDGTLESLSAHPGLRVVSEPDRGIYDALNKGIGLSEGDVVGFLNTDDVYEPDSFGTVARAFADDVEAVVGGATVFSGTADVMAFPAVATGELLERTTVGAPVFNAWFFRRTLLQEVGGFDLRYRYVADRDLLIRLAFRGLSYAPVERQVYRYRMHPGSITLSGSESGEAPYMFEMRRLARSLLDSREPTPSQRRLLTAWHSQIAREQVLAAYHAGAPLRAVRHALGGVRRDPHLSLTLAGEVVERLRAGVSSERRDTGAPSG